MFTKKWAKKKLSLRNLIGLKGGYEAFIDSIKYQIVSTKNRYLIKEDELKNELFTLKKIEEKTDPQLHYTFQVTTSLDEDLGTIEFYLGHNEQSYYLGHLVHHLKNHDYDIDIFRYLGKIAKDKGMHYLYIVPDGKPTIPVYNALGINIKKTIKVPTDSKFYRKNHKHITQYKYEL